MYGFLIEFEGAKNLDVLEVLAGAMEDVGDSWLSFRVLNMI